MSRPFLALIPLLALLSCTDAAQRQPRVDKGTGLVPAGLDTTAKGSIAGADKPAIPVFHYEYDSSLTNNKNLEAGWMDRFSLNGVACRVRIDTTDPGRLCFEENRNGSWRRDFSFIFCDDGYGLGDEDGDGYTDFSYYYHDNSYTSRYDPKTKTLEAESFVLPEDVSVFNKRRRIFFNHVLPMYTNLYESSDLYTFRNGKPYFYGKLELQNDWDGPMKIVLSRFRSGDPENVQSRKIVREGTSLRFNYEQLWRTYSGQLIE